MERLRLRVMRNNSWFSRLSFRREAVLLTGLTVGLPLLGVLVAVVLPALLRLVGIHIGR